MSVTFSVENPTYKITRYNGGIHDVASGIAALSTATAVRDRLMASRTSLESDVTFEVEEEQGLNLANANARDVIRFIGLPSDLAGEIRATELAALCRRALIRDVEAPLSPEREESREKSPGGPTMIYCGRRAGYLEEKARALLALAEYAGTGVVRWS